MQTIGAHVVRKGLCATIWVSLHCSCLRLAQWINFLFAAGPFMAFLAFSSFFGILRHHRHPSIAMSWMEWMAPDWMNERATIADCWLWVNLNQLWFIWTERNDDSMIDHEMGAQKAQKEIERDRQRQTEEQNSIIYFSPNKKRQVNWSFTLVVPCVLVHVEQLH